MTDKPCLECGNTEYRYLNCDSHDDPRDCQEVICTTCGADAPA